jgi:hypothetical protein
MRIRLRAVIEHSMTALRRMAVCQARSATISAIDFRTPV